MYSFTFEYGSHRCELIMSYDELKYKIHTDFEDLV